MDSSSRTDAPRAPNEARETPPPAWRLGRPARVYVVDDHPIIRAAFATLLRGEADLELAGEASGAEEALRGLDAARPDLIVVDLGLKGANGLELIKLLRARVPEVPLLAYSMFDESLYAPRVLAAGARGYASKDVTPEELRAAMRKVLGGGVYLSEAMTRQMLLRTTGVAAPAHDARGTLTDRELEVLERLGEGLTINEIAARLHLSIKTIETHRAHLRAKLGLTNNSQLLQRAVLWRTEG